MSNEDKITQLLAQMAISLDRHEQFFAVLQDLAVKQTKQLENQAKQLENQAKQLENQAKQLENQAKQLENQTKLLETHNKTLIDHNDVLLRLDNTSQRQERILNRQEKLLERILEAVTGDIPRFEEIIDVETLDNGKRIILHRSKYSSSSI
jgi:septal ring factor EnvC (AmiA/AmiB activator)